MPPGPDAWTRARELFERALRLPPADRAGFVATACGGDDPLRVEVERMLEAHGRTAGFLSTPALAPFGDATDGISLENLQLGPFVVASRIGEGGMGEVFRARDTRLHRDVALKVLPPFVADDPDRLARFRREAQALAALNHANIAAIHGFEEHGRTRALVLELVEGETLGDRLRRGAIPVAEALNLARQIADAIDAAHQQGIVHRDLKPSNIAVTGAGVVKVLDFGLAKLMTPSEGPARDVSLPPTVTSPAVLTGTGLLLGTAAYMSPEQARGRPVDERADIWSFGAVLYEMLTGTRAFDGDSVTETLGAVMHRDVDWSRLPSSLPPAARVVLKQCLQKDLQFRIRDMGDVRLALDGAFMPEVAAGRGRAGTTIGVAALAATVLLAAIGSGAGVWLYTRADSSARLPRHPIRIDFSLPSTTGPPPELSPDGRSLVFQAAGRHHVYSFEAASSRPLASGGGSPSWSPDGRSLVFPTGGRLMRVDVADGRMAELCDVEVFGGASWTAGDVILFADAGKGIMRVSAAGGTPVQLTRVDSTRDESEHRLPWALPDGRHFLYLRLSKTPDRSGIYIGRLDASPETESGPRLVGSEKGAAYSPGSGDSGHLLFVRRDGTLMAQRFDEHTRQLEGEPAALVRLAEVRSPRAQFSVSATGALAYVRAGEQSRTAVWVDPDGGRVVEITGSLPGAVDPRLSSDDRKLALVVTGDVWVYDLDGGPPVRLTFDGAAHHPYLGHSTPLWTPDDKDIVYEDVRGGGISRLPAAGGSTPMPAGPEGHFHPQAWSPDGRQLLALRWEGSRLQDLVRFEPRADGRIETILPVPVSTASVSPDGRWLAYTSPMSGQAEVWVRPFSQPGAARQVSFTGGAEPLWSRDGRTLFYLANAGMMAAAVVPAEPGAPFAFEPARRLFDAAAYARSGTPSYDVARDGRFVMLKGGDLPITVVLNWAEQLRQRTSRGEPLP